MSDNTDNVVHVNCSSSENVDNFNFVKSTCLLFNARSICNKIHEFNAIVSVTKPSIIAVTETWFNSNTMCDSLLDPDNKYKRTECGPSQLG